ncbi:hypothetical protein Ahy_B08g092080 [Arachis hypogaea]|uniref:Protein FAR1-RELATED SEQUENCE n=1 Tax=Arachis hypogaea TaxID=3818 RepID=A0A444Y375_ARAHY|nr:hypothetical protein Ahy_B08g092080 [Arachis hypogaea]
MSRSLTCSCVAPSKPTRKRGIRPSKTYQSFVAAAGSHRELSFIKKDVRNYITKEVRNISEQDDAKEFGKYLLRMKEKNQNFFFELNLEADHCIKHAFWADTKSRAAFLCSVNVQIVVHHGLVQSSFRFFCGHESPWSIDASQIRADE